MNKSNMIKKRLFFSILTLLPFLLQAQQTPEVASVEKSIFGVQFSSVGFWANNETKLSNTIALRSEIGFRITNIRLGNPIYRIGNEPFIPLVLILEPRYYYQIKKRYSQGLRIDNNTGYYLSLKIRHHAGWFMLSGSQPSNIEIIPCIAFRENIGKHFNYEIGGGMGYQHTFTSIREEKEYWAFNIVLRIGYTF